ncbi:MAG: LptF/LptG family permease [Terriglobales bacterium]
MRMLSRYIRREVALYAALALLLFTFVLFMQDLGRAMEAAVHANAGALAQLVAYVMPEALVFTLPMAVVAGLLLALGRLGSDGELMALAASGVGARRLVRPLLGMAVVALGLALFATLWLAPAARQRLGELTERLASSQIASAIQPRVFFEPGNNPNWVVYAGDIKAGGSQWDNVLVAQMASPQAPELTLASRGTLLRRGRGELQLHLTGGTRYRVDPAKPDTSLVSEFQSVDIPFLLPAERTGPPALSAEASGPLWQRAHYAADWRAARVEYYRRWALAFACLALALAGIAVGLSGRRGGRAGGFVWTLVLVVVYYLLFLTGMSLAREGRLPPFWGVWAANLIFFAGGAWALWRLDRHPPQARERWDAWAWLRAFLPGRVSRRRGHGMPEVARQAGHSWMPSLLSGYVTRAFLGATILLLVAFVVLVLIFTLFELFGSILQHHVAASTVIAYLFYFSPQMLYRMTPVALLVGVMIAIGLLAKSNEITALKACGVSVYRLLVPVVVVAGCLCGLQFALGATWLPVFNQRQNALHDQIKGQPAQTYRNPERKWVFGRGHDVYYFRFYDTQAETFDDVSVFQFDPGRFQLTRRIFAQQARWDSAIHTWVFTNGWARRFDASGQTSFERFLVGNFSGLPETPSYFATDARQGTQMSYLQLRHYVTALRRSGYNVSRLEITLAKKISYPLITLVMALLAFPFALSVGRRGALAGISAGIAVAIAYWSCASLLEALGNLNQLPAAVAAWTPDVLFLGLGVYLLLRVPT